MIKSHNHPTVLIVQTAPRTTHDQMFINGMENAQFQAYEITLSEIEVSDFKEPTLDLVVINMPGVAHLDERIVPRLRSVISRFERQGVPVAISGEFKDAAAVISLNRMGVSHFLKARSNIDEIGELVVRQTRQESTAQRMEKSEALTIGVYAPRRGAGATMLSVNLAVALAESFTKKAIVCDFGYQCNSAAVQLNLFPRHTIQNLLGKPHSIERSVVENILANHESGVRVLPSVNDFEKSIEETEGGSIDSILQLLKGMADCLILDLNHLAHGVRKDMHRHCKQILVIASPDVPSLRGLATACQDLCDNGLSEEQFKIVINRAGSKASLGIREIEKEVRRSIDYVIPNDYPICIEASNTGKPVRWIKRTSGIAKAIDHIAGSVLTGQKKNKASQGWFSTKLTSRLKNRFSPKDRALSGAGRIEGM
jgi:Flp pilus assembly CpaE family ATPase